MLNKALEAFGDLGDDEELGPADWCTVKGYIASLNNLEGECVPPYGAPEDDDNLDHMNLEDIRIRLLNGKFIIIVSAPESDNNLDPMNFRDINMGLLNGRFITMFHFSPTIGVYC